jgi:hypothetical protein
VHSSTSSSSAEASAGTDRDASGFLVRIVVVVCVLLAVEAAARFVIVPASNTQRRIEADLRATLKLASSSQRPSVLIVGNSLLVEGVRVDSLRAQTSNSLEVQPLGIEQTLYFDWIYGLGHLRVAGSRPDVVAVMLPRIHVLSPGFRGPYSVFRLVDTPDIPSLARDLHVHPTVSSGYYLAEVSSFYSMRANLRNIFLPRMVPRMDMLAKVFGGYAAFSKRVVPPALDTLSLARERLRRMKEVVEAMGARLLWIIPPSGVQPATFDPARDLTRQAAREVGVDVFELEETAPVAATAYLDGFHLNDAGALAYTSDLSRELLRRYRRR